MSHELKHYLEGSWHQLKGAIQENWGKLTDDEFDKIEGKQERMLGFLQKEYGLTKGEAEKQLHDFLKEHHDK